MNQTEEPTFERKGDPVSDASSIRNSQRSGEQKPARKKSKTEELAGMLGQSRESMEASRDKTFKEQRKSNRAKFTRVFVLTAITLAIFFAEKLDPNGGENLLRYLQQSSASQEVIGNGQPTIIEFSASWCRTCKDMAHNMFDLENKYANRVNFIVIDGENPDNVSIMESFGVEGIPQFAVLDGSGKNMANFFGYVPQQVFEEDIEALLREEKQVPHPGLTVRDLLPSLMDE